MNREALRALADALPPGAAVPVPREWLLELLGAVPEVATAAGPDPTVVDLAHRFGRSPSTIRWWIESNRFPGAYRFRGKEWRVPAAAVAAFEADERTRRTPAPIGAGAEGAGAVVDLGAWRKVG